MCEKASFLALCQAGEEQADPHEIHKRLLGTGAPCIVFTQAPLAPQPGNGALDDPASGDDVESRSVAQIGEHVGDIALDLAIGRVG